MLENIQRITGYDIARALTVFIMVIINFNLVLTRVGDDGILSSILNLLQGKGSTLFVVLTGAGISLMIKTVLLKNDKIKLREKLNVLLKRALFLFIFGLIYLPLWPGDILHYYGFYISIGTLLMTSRSKILWIITALIIVSYPLILEYVNYEAGWNWKINEYTDFWTVNGFIRNLFVNGFNPVLPWIAFVLAGIWLGRQDLKDKNKRVFILWVSLPIFVIVQMVSNKLIDTAILYDISTVDAVMLFETKPMPPMPLFMISGISWSFVITIMCIWITEKMDKKNRLDTLVKTGQMAFTHYILHVLVGILGAYIFFEENNLCTLATLLYALFFCLLIILFSNFWRKKYLRSPISQFMRFITG